MSKYFKEKELKKESISLFLDEITKEYSIIEGQLLKTSNSDYTEYFKITKMEHDIKLKLSRVKYIFKCLGDVKISKDVLDTICESFDSSKCRYGTTCFKPDSVKALYEISETFKRLSSEALLTLSRTYIKDLFDENSLIAALSLMLHKEGETDETFEKFLEIVKKFADIQDKKFESEAVQIKWYFDEYTYKFVTHFEKFMKEHHITLKRFAEVTPTPELFFKDELQLNEFGKKSRECFSVCTPISFQMLEDYLDGDTELSQFQEHPTYSYNLTGKEEYTTFTKQEFLESIKEKQKILRK